MPRTLVAAGLLVSIVGLASCANTQSDANDSTLMTTQSPGTHAADARTLPDYFLAVRDGGLSEEDVQLVRDEAPFSEISLEISNPWLATYTITFLNDGTAVHDCGFCRDSKDDRAGAIDMFIFARLNWAIQKMLEPADSTAYTYEVHQSDAITLTLRLTERDTGKVITISDYGDQGPIELWTIHNIILGLERRIQWSPPIQYQW